VVHGEVDAALRAAEAGEAVGHVEDSLAVRAGQLDLRGVHPLSRRRALPGLRRRRERRIRRGFGGRRRRRGRVGLGHQLRREALRHAALGADELGHAGADREDAVATGAAHLYGRGGRRGGRAAGHRRRPHGEGFGAGEWGCLVSVSFLAREEQERNRNGTAGSGLVCLAWYLKISRLVRCQMEIEPRRKLA
jgi:hypothetical protein